MDRREIWSLLMLLAAYVIAYNAAGPESYATINQVGPVAMLGILMLGAWWQLSQDSLSIWLPLFWFRVATSAYYGVGAIAPYIANETTILNIYSLYSFSGEEALKVGLLNVACVFAVLATASVVTSAASRQIKTRGTTYSQKHSNVLMYASIFLIAGGIARYSLALPVALGLVHNIPGIIAPLAKSYAVGLCLLVLAGFQGVRFAGVLAAVLIVIDLGIGLLTFAKVEVLLTLIFVFLGVLHHKATVARILLGMAVIIGIYSQLDPIIHYGRDEVWRRHQSPAASLTERLEILSLYGDAASRQSTEVAESQSSLSRLCYLNASAMVVNYFDGGAPGDSLEYALAVLVPRLLWEDKPEITAVGKKLYLKASSQEGSSISPGLFGEAYWNFGWPGVLYLMVPLGVVLGVMSKYALDVMRREAWMHMPALLMGISIGMRVDGWYVADVIGASATAAAIALACVMVERKPNVR